jgi:hypothetical protein
MDKRYSATGYDAGAIPKAYAHLPRYEKPVAGRDLALALAHALAPQRLPRVGV